MELKEYQQGVLNRVDQYLATLLEERRDAEDYAEFQRRKGKTPSPQDYCQKTWQSLQARGTDYLPALIADDGDKKPAPWVSRRDGLGRDIPNICLKVPTGGGKTLLACAVLERLQTDYFRHQTGFVLWVVPSEAIYRQTWKQLANREHPYRQMLERASGGRVKLLEKNDPFTAVDTAQYLCVMLLMLPSAARQSKETLRMFRDSGRFTSFFPELDDAGANQDLLEHVRNLDCNDLADLPPGAASSLLSIKHSLGNVLRLLHPVIVIDEGHKAYSNTARDTLCGFNPRFILELSATPNANGHHSNVLVSIAGKDLKDEEMIKLPINISNSDDKGDWHHTLSVAYQKLEELGQQAQKFQAESGRYIRPIMLIRVERVGKEQRDSGYVHAEDVREYLTTQLGVMADEVRLKTAETNELGNEDLLKDTSPVRYIITKDALREGWDCPFAYILVALSRTTANTTLTQMIGRILRQPGAQRTGHALLDECYVFTFDQEVTQAVAAVKSGLQDEGMADVSGHVRSTNGSGKGNGPKPIVVRRRAQFSEPPVIFLPRILHRDASDWRALDYERDILGELDWETFNYRGAHDFHVDPAARKETHARVSVSDSGGQEELYLTENVLSELPESGLDKPFLVRQLLDIVPNPWQGVRILDTALDTLGARGLTDSQLFNARLDLIQDIRADLRRQVSERAEQLFKRKLEQGDLKLSLASAHDPELTWKLHDTLEILAEEVELRRKNGGPLERSLFEKVPANEFNSLERNTALYLDEASCVRWWHRLAVRQGHFSLQGWQRQQVYPDLLVCLSQTRDGAFQMAVLETKGNHLAGNDDTVYKRNLFQLLNDYAQYAIPVGELALGQPVQLRFAMLMEGAGPDAWKQDLLQAVPELIAGSS